MDEPTELEWEDVVVSKLEWFDLWTSDMNYAELDLKEWEEKREEGRDAQTTIKRMLRMANWCLKGGHDSYAPEAVKGLTEQLEMVESYLAIIERTYNRAVRAQKRI